MALRDAVNRANQNLADMVSGDDDLRGMGTTLTALLAEGSRPTPVAVQPEWPFNIIYSSGTTGIPKGIVQSHGMRWSHVDRGSAYGYGPETVTLLATPLYSNTTLVVFFPTIAFGGPVVLMSKFDAAGYVAKVEQAASHDGRPLAIDIHLHGGIVQGLAELQVADADGYGAQTILASNEPIISPAWSPAALR